MVHIEIVELTGSLVHRERFRAISEIILDVAEDKTGMNIIRILLNDSIDNLKIS